MFHFAYKRNLASIEGSWFGSWAPERMIWDTIIYKPIWAMLEGRVRFVLCGGAPLSSDTEIYEYLSRVISSAAGLSQSTIYCLN
jgi:long-chain acyl-CoA synthetase